MDDRLEQGVPRPDEGEVTVDGTEITKLDEDLLQDTRKKVGMLFQAGALFDSMTVYENVAFALQEHTVWDEGKIRARVAEVLGLVELNDVEQLMPSDLSGGMRKRVALARAIALSPRGILYDEPTTGLDPITSDIINNLIVELNEKLNVTSVAVTHDMTSAFKIASRIVMLYEGKIEIDGSPEDIKNTTNEIVKQFITGRAQGPIKVR